VNANQRDSRPGLHPIFTHAFARGRHAVPVVARAGYVNGYNRRAPGLSVLIVEPREEQLATTVARYVLRVSFAMAALPDHALAAANIVAFDGVVVPPAIDEAVRGDLIERLVSSGVSRIVECDDPIVVARELRTIALTRGVRSAARRHLLHA
jgi:hypothetical protein